MKNYRLCEGDSFCSLRFSKDPGAKVKVFTPASKSLFLICTSFFRLYKDKGSIGSCCAHAALSPSKCAGPLSCFGLLFPILLVSPVLFFKLSPNASSGVPTVSFRIINQVANLARTTGGSCVPLDKDSDLAMYIWH